MDMDFRNKNVVFLGIGGISMSALARLVFSMGANVFGSDIKENEQTKFLAENKIAKIRIGNVPSFVINCDFVVYSSAIPKNNPDLKLAKRLKKKVLERSTMLGILSCKYKNVIAISGTHGKTTTTSLLGWIFETSKQNPTVHIGGVCKNFGSNLKLGENKYFITEACEYKKSFLQLNPNTTIINNIELDHPDCYKNIEEIQSAFIQLSKQTKNNLIVNGDLINKKLFKSKNLLTFGFNKSNTLFANKISFKNNFTTFDIFYKHKKLGNISTTMLGKHNILNILAATLTALVYQIDFFYIQTAIQSFEGTKRRFETFFDNSFKMILDYAHHPSEIRCCLETAKTIEHSRLIVVFQPHTYSRTKALLKEFSSCFDGADMLFVLPTYSAREKEIVGGRAIDLFYSIKNVKTTQYVTNAETLCYMLDNTLLKGDLVLWIGAGDIEIVAKEYIKTLNKFK